MLDPFWRLLGLSYFGLFHAISLDSYAITCLIYTILCYFYVCKLKNAYIKDLDALSIFMILYALR